MSLIHAASAANRFGLGARDDELVHIDSDPRGWLLAQLREPIATSGPVSLPDSGQYLDWWLHAHLKKTHPDAIARQQIDGGSDYSFKSLRRLAQRDILVRQRRGVLSKASFAERIVRFWSNHFAVSVDKSNTTLFAESMEREAILPNAFARFSDLLRAVTQHPGMLMYLDNRRSTGADSSLAGITEARAARSGKTSHLGLNENLARELLELHTLGVEGGYTQADVTELAKAITGWSVRTRKEGATKSSGIPFAFRDNAHEPGPRTVFGRTYAEAGRSQGEAILRDLAMQPATARHIAYKLSRHFVADSPPAGLVERMAAAYLRTGGELAALYAAMVEDERAWSPAARKFKTPDDLMISALRACGLDREADVDAGLQLQANLGQPVFRPRSPAGFGDFATDWGGPDALLKRIQAAQILSQRVVANGTGMPMEHGRAALGPGLDAETGAALRRAESVQQGFALLLASPAFQWRS